MANTKATKILMRNGTQQEWINADTVAALEIGEIGFESDTYRLKIGNDASDTIGALYKQIEYFAAGIVSIQEVDATHENGLMIDADGVLELDIGNLVGRIDNHDSVFAEHADSIEALRAGFDTVSNHLDSIESEHHDSILVLGDSITTNIDAIDSLNHLCDSISESIDTLNDSIDAIEIKLDDKVSKAGDTMFGTLSFEPAGIIEASDGSNIYLRNDLTIIQTELMVSDDAAFFGEKIETNDSYVAVSDNDIVDVKSLPDLNLDINRAVTHSTKKVDGGNIYRSTADTNKIVYTPSIELVPIADEMLALIGALDPDPDSVTAGELRDIMVEFFGKLRQGVSFDLSDPVEYTDD